MYSVTPRSVTDCLSTKPSSSSSDAAPFEKLHQLPSSDELARRVGTPSFSVLTYSTKPDACSETPLPILEPRFALDKDLRTASFLFRLLRLLSVLDTVTVPSSISKV